MWALIASVASADTPSRPNFLFIAIDDLNDFAGYVAEEPGNFLQVIYPDATIRARVCKQLTPNLDKLARNSAPFARAYCPSALCGPSRTSLMTGVPPHRSGYYNHQRHFRTYDTLKDAVTLPQQLKNSGYFTTGLGKLFHKPTGTVNGSIKNDWADARNSWSVWLNHSTGCNGGKPGKYSPPNGGNMVFGRSRLPLENSGDWMAADFVARLLEHGEATMKPEGRRGNDGPASVKLPSDQSFFLGCGLFRPHLPFYAPSEFFDLFPTENMSGLNRESLEGIVADLDDLPTGAQRFSDFKNGKMRVVMDHAKSLGADEEVAAWRAMVQSYLACVAYADACLGRLIEGYEKSPQHNNTVLLLWSDHGYHLGSKYHVAKQALWEEANRVQFIVHDPRKPKSCDGKLRRQIVSLNDLYPTICEMAGTEVGPQVEVGRSLVSLIDDADAEPVHDHLLMTYQEGNHSIRTATHKLSCYKDESIELYDMLADPTQSNNLAGKAEVKVIQEKLVKALDNSVASTEGLSATSSGSDRPVDRPTLTNNPLQVDGHDFYAADPSVVIADDGRLFMFPTTDHRDWEKQFGWSSYSTNNLVDWTNHGVIFSNEDSAWGVNKAWAPDITKKDGKYYLYYYFNNGGGGKGGVGVAVADQPEGPFRELTKEKLCRGHDPAVFADDDGRYWMYLQDKVYELGDDMASLKSGPMDLNLEYRPEKFEADYVFKRNDIYYFTIAQDWNNLIYYTGKSPTGPFEYRGEFMKPYGGNNHHSIIQFQGRWILFYHEWVKNDPVHQRRLRAEYLNFNDDGTIQMVEPTNQGIRFDALAEPTANDVSQTTNVPGLRYSGKVDWDSSTGTVSFRGSGSMPDSREEFFWGVPASVKKIVIETGVTVRGAFRVTYRAPTNPLVIAGRDRKTSVIEGTEQKKWTERAGIAESDKWRYGAINVVEDAIVHVSNLTSRNPRGYNISGYANKAVIHVDGCDLLDTRGGDNNNSDGFLGSAGSSIRNSFISTSDDAIKVYHDITIKNVTILQHRNGAPLQFGWHDENETATATIKDLTIRGVASDGNYNMAPLTWVSGQHGIRHVNIDGLTIDLQGHIYNETSDTWQPIGLMSVKPTQCTLNLTVQRAKLGGLPNGFNAAKGSVGIDRASSADNTVDQTGDTSKAMRTTIASHDRAVQVLDEKIRDPFITRGPDDNFYLTGTTAGTHWGDTIGIRLWKSTDLIEWEDLGFVWDLNKDGKQQNSWHFDRPAKEGVKNGRAIWAPEIHYLNGTWWIPHSVNVAGHGLLRSVSGKPDGPYEALPAIADQGIDAHLFQEDGKTYYLWGYDKIVRMRNDLSGTAEPPKRISPSGKHPLGYEGILIQKIGNKYLLIASGRYGYESSDTYDLYYCVADSLHGPYGPRRMAVKNAGHGNLFQDNNGRWWCTAFDHEFVESKNRWTPWIVPIEIIETDDAIIIEVKDERFRPTAADQRQVKQLNVTGVPSGREGKKPWDK